MSGKGITVAVTGVSGFVGGVLVNELITRGYHVNGTVRDLNDKSKVAHLNKDFPQNLTLFEADLMKEGSFHDSFQGCKYLFHTASPFFLNPKDAQKELVDPAVNGTINALNEAFKVPTIDTIVLTSSVAACRRWDKPEGYILTEADWNDTANVTNMPYPYSKVAAEKKAWELVEAHNKTEAGQQHPVRLVTICPSYVIGPPFGSRVDGTSVSQIIALLDGSQVESGVAPSQLPNIDVRDVAKAHVEAAERKEASGRYILSSRDVRGNLEYAEIFRKLYPNKAFPTKYKEGKMSWFFGTDPSKAEKELGIQLIPLEQSLKDMAEKLTQLGMVQFKDA